MKTGIFAVWCALVLAGCAGTGGFFHASNGGAAGGISQRISW
ncbi:hypothetical protein [Neisseria leonii]|nr:hypothetical protein [Neisseria sp. 3986]MDD9325911.1 hypothetical protein [Neisseria sp. 3986]